MSIVIQLFNGSPKKRKGEKMAGVILTRDPKLGFRMKVQALPSKREIHRLVSDCPLAISEQTLLWLQRHKWQWKLHPNSLDVRELLSQVKTYTNLLPPEHIGDACDLLMSNFTSKGQEKAIAEQPSQQQASNGLTADQMQQQMAMMQRQVMAMQQHMQQGSNTAEPIVTDPISAKLQRTQQRHSQTMAHVNAVVEQNERKKAIQEEAVANIDDIVAEVDDIVGNDVIQDEEVNAVDAVDTVEEIEIEVPDMFKSPQEAIDWAMDLEIFDSLDEAKDMYKDLKNEEKPKTAVAMAKIWTDTCLEIYDIVNDDDSEEEE